VTAPTVQALTANANAILIQSTKVAHEGWKRDNAATEPTEWQFATNGTAPTQRDPPMLG
jgi:hypothetical protein